MPDAGEPAIGHYWQNRSSRRLRNVHVVDDHARIYAVFNHVKVQDFRAVHR